MGGARGATRTCWTVFVVFVVPSPLIQIDPSAPVTMAVGKPLAVTAGWEAGTPTIENSSTAGTSGDVTQSDPFKPVVIAEG